MKVLYLSVWYPSDKDKMAGLFVQKHAEAVAAQGAEVRVNTWWPEADVVQLNVLTLKLGLVAYVLKRVFGIPYFIVEHWSAYLPQNGTYQRLPKWKKRILEEIAHEASGIYPVSQRLEDAMKDCGIQNKTWGRIHNVVDDFFYVPYDNGQMVNGQMVNILHVSCFDEAPKNVRGLLRAVKALSRERQDFSLTLVGTGKDWQMCRDYARELDIPEQLLRWTGELPPEKVCREMQRADFFVLPSRWENAPVVLSECIAVGLPVISTRVGGIPEMVTDEIGLLVEPDSDDALTEGLRHMLDHYAEYDPVAIRQHGMQFRFDVVGKRLQDIYKELAVKV